MSQFEEHAWYRKRQLIDRAKSIAYNGDLRKGHDEIRALQADWKAAGRAGTDSEGIDQDDSLYREFKQAKDAFYDRRKQVNDRVIAEKNSLIYRMGRLGDRTYDKTVGEEMRNLSTKWNEAGHAFPKSVDDQLWREFDKQKQRVIAERKRLSDAHTDRQKAWLVDKISQTESWISTLESRLYEARLTNEWDTRPEPSIRNPRYYEIMAKRREREQKKNDRISKLYDQLESAKEKLRSLQNQLREL